MNERTTRRRLGRLATGVGIGALSVVLAGTPASAYSCSVMVNVNVGDTTAVIQGSGAVPNSDVTLSSTCFAAVTVPTTATGTFSATVALNPGLPGGTNCPVTADSSYACGSFSIREQEISTTQPSTSVPSVTQVGGNSPGETTTTVEVLGNNTDNTAPDAGNTAGPTASSDSGKLPFTGMETAGLVTAGALMLGGGALLVSSVRRRQPA